jgi:hypothetical protein
MKDNNKILIVEDQSVDYERIFNKLYNYERYPPQNEFDVFKMHLRGWIEMYRKDEAEAYFNKYFDDKEFQAIILDIKLGREKTDKSGLEFLKFLRGRYYKHTPIIMLTDLPLKNVKEGLTSAMGMANYYLHKRGPQEKLSENFFNNELKPVLTMLIYWYEMSPPERIIRQIVDTSTNEVIEELNSRYGMLASQLDIMHSHMEDLKDYAKVNLAIIRYYIKIDNRKAYKLAEKLIEEFELADDVPNLERYRTSIIKQLRNMSADIANSLKGETEKELIDLLQDTVRERLSLDEDDPILLEILKISCNFMKKHVKALLLFL